MAVVTEELGDAVPEKPVIFTKFSGIMEKGKEGEVLDVSSILPTDKGAVHYEAEICLQLGVRVQRLHCTIAS